MPKINRYWNSDPASLVELEVNNRIYIINPNNVCYVSLGDGTLPSKSSLSVNIKFNDGCLFFPTNTSDEANKLYKRIKWLLNNRRENNDCL